MAAFPHSGLYVGIDLSAEVPINPLLRIALGARTRTALPSHDFWALDFWMNAGAPSV